MPTNLRLKEGSNILTDYGQGINFPLGNIKKRMYIHDPSSSNSSFRPNKTKVFLLRALICLEMMALIIALWASLWEKFSQCLCPNKGEGWYQEGQLASETLLLLLLWILDFYPIMFILGHHRKQWANRETFNSHIGADNNDYESVYGRHGFDQRNEVGTTNLEFASHIARSSQIFPSRKLRMRNTKSLSRVGSTEVKLTSLC